MLDHRLRRWFKIKPTLAERLVFAVCYVHTVYSANAGHSPNAVSMLGQGQRQWVNIKTAVGQH